MIDKKLGMKNKIFLLIFSTFLIFLHCKKQEESVKDIIEKGKVLLGQEKYSEAGEMFLKAINKEPENPEARFGMALVQTAIFLKNLQDTVLELGNTLAQLIGGLSPHITPKQETTINTLLDDIFESNIISVIEKINENLKYAAQKKDWSFKIEKLTLKLEFGGQELWKIDISGEFDSADANLLYSAFKILSALIKFLLSIDLDIKIEDLSRLYSFIQNFGGINQIAQDPSSVILRIVPFLLNQRENLLGVRKDEKGARYWKNDIPQDIIDAMVSLQNSYDSLLSETDDQADDIIIPVEKGEGVIKKIAFPTSSSFFADQTVSSDFKRSLATIELPQNLKGTFEKIKGSFEGTARVRWKELLDTFLTFAIAFVKTGIFDTLITSLIKSFGTSGLPEGILSNLSQFVNPTFISSIIVGIIPDEIEFDFHAFFSSDKGLRGILPAWTDDNVFILEWECVSSNPAISPLAKSNILTSFFCKMPKDSYCFESSTKGNCDIRLTICEESLISEKEFSCISYCPTNDSNCNKQNQKSEKICLVQDNTTGECKLYCTESRINKSISGDESKICVSEFFYEDKEHFYQNYKPGLNSTLPEKIDKDSITGILPYIGFQSPDFYGMIYLNSNYLKSISDKVQGQGFKRPNQFETNLFLQKIGDNLKRILSQFGFI